MRRVPAPVAGKHATSTGVVELVPGDTGSRWTLLIDGVPSSPVDVEHPEHLAFEYLAWMDAVLAAQRGPRGPVAAVHLGGAGCALPWAWSRTRPGSRQLVVEVDAELARLVREWFDLPAKPALRIRVGDAREVLRSRPDTSADVVVRDVFADAVTPLHVTTREFTAQVARVLRPGGLYLANVADAPPLLGLRRELATVREVFRHVAVVAETGTLKGRRFANSVMVAGDTPLDVTAVHRGVARTGVAATVLHGERLHRMIAGAPALTD